MNVLEVEHLTKDYGSGRGVFDVSFAVKEGEVFGFLGPMVQVKVQRLDISWAFQNLIVVKR